MAAPGDTHAALVRAKDRLDELDLYPRPVALRGVRVLVAPWFFRLPRLRRYRGYALRRTILVRDPVVGRAADDLLVHELCHVWQMQHRLFHVVWTYLTSRYSTNRYEREAREAVRATASRAGGR